ncbi:MAG: hypothetical protein QXO65_03575 [Candidatus Aenigmatarchaeota archaeon]
MNDYDNHAILKYQYKVNLKGKNERYRESYYLIKGFINILKQEFPSIRNYKTNIDYFIKKELDYCVGKRFTYREIFLLIMLDFEEIMAKEGLYFENLNEIIHRILENDNKKSIKTKNIIKNIIKFI